MQDHHVEKISSALNSIASAISYLAFTIIFGSLIIQCALTMHH